MTGFSQDKLQDVTALVIERAKIHGADAADAVVIEGVSVATAVRLGNLEDVERSEGQDMSLRVFCGDSQASVSTTDFTAASLDEAASRAVAMAKLAPGDEFAGLADENSLARMIEDLDLFDTAEPSATDLESMALEAEETALAVDGVTNSIGASAGFGSSGVVLSATNGFSGAYRRTGFSLSCSVLAGEGTGMERDYDYCSKVHLDDLDSPQDVGRKAAERAVARLAPRKMPSQSAPVVFDPRVGSQLLANFSSAISGAAIARGTSFLKESLGEQVFAKSISIIDDPKRLRGLRSKPFDGEGVSAEALRLVDNGMLTTWLLDCRSARQLGLTTNGRAGRGGGSISPGATNLYMQPGNKSPAELMAGIKSGIFVDLLMGRGGSVITGDFSEGVAGFWIEDGKISFPVSEMTIAGNLKDMFVNLEPADDLEFRGAINTPTLRVEGMTLAGL